MPTAQVSSEKKGTPYIRPRYLQAVSKRGLSDVQIERVLGRLNVRLARVHEGNASALAEEIGMSQPAMWQLLNRRTRPSFGTVETLARLEGVAVESILSSPRDSAARIAREGGVPAAAIARVLSEPEVDRPILWWIDRMRLVAHTLTDDAPASGAVPSSTSRKPAA